MNPKHCVGCRQNFYNIDPRHNGCWHLEDAKLVPTWAIDYNTPTIQENFYSVGRKPNCYRKTGYLFVDKRELKKFPK